MCFSCYPLLERDGLSLAYVGVMGAFASVIGGGAPPPPSGGGGGGGEGEGEGERERRWWGRVDAVSAAVTKSLIERLGLPPPRPAWGAPGAAWPPAPPPNGGV